MQGDTPAFSPQELLEHAPFLRHLARELVGDDHGAADVLQDAYVAALERPPREAHSPRGWLAVVVSNLARNARRGGRRRSERERAVARPERQESDSGALALERLDVQRVLIELLMALPEEQRTVLYLRYFEEETPSAIATRLGVPVKTVKTRHTRALATLRARLDERSGGDRTVWVSALLPWIEVRPGAGVPVHAKLAAALVVVAAGTFLAWKLRRTPPVEPEIAHAVTMASETPASSIRPTAAGRETVSAATRERGALAPALSGTVRWIEDDSPAEGVVVEARAGAATSSATTDAEGRYRIEWTAEIPSRSVILQTSNASATPTRALSSRSSPPVADDADLWVTRGATLEATVVDRSGAPVPGARVCVRFEQGYSPSLPCDRDAIAGGDGRFRVEHIAEVFTLTAEAPGFACEYGLRGTLPPGSVASGLQVVLAEAVEFRGSVVDLDGKPVAGAELAVNSSGSSSDRDATTVAGVSRFEPVDLRARSDERGAFVLGPAPRRRRGVRATHPRFLDRDTVLEPDGDARIELDPGYSLAGRVSGWNRAPVAGAKVSVRAGSGSWRETTTGAEGRFDLQGLASGQNAFVLVEAEGHAVFARQPVVVGPGGESFLELRLEPPAPLAGRVLDTDSRPLVGALVHVEGERLLAYDDVDFGERTTVEWAAGANETRTDADGRFRLPALYAGRFQVRVSPADDPRLALSFETDSGREDLEIVLDRARLERVVFAGSVLSSTGDPLRSFTVEVQRIEEDGSSRGEGQAFGPAAGGRFRLAGFEPGRYRLDVHATGHAIWSAEPREFRAGESDFEVVLYPSCAVELVVRDARRTREGDHALLNRPARVEFHDLDGRPLWLEWGQSTRSLSIGVGQEPRALSGLPRGPVRLTASCAGYSPTTLDLDLTLPPSEPLEVLMNLEPGGELANLQLYVALTDEPALAGALDLESVPRALSEGQLRKPDVSVQLDFLDERGEVVARGEVIPLGDGRFQDKHSLYLEMQSSESSDTEPALGDWFPVRIRQVLARAEGCRDQRLALDLVAGERSFVGVALLRERRR